MKAKVKKHTLDQKVKLHNEFTLEITEFETEDCLKIKKKWEAKAYNTILNQGLTKMVNAWNGSRFTDGQGLMSMNDLGDTASYSYCLGGWIQVGTGDTTPVATNTVLNAYLNYKEAFYFDSGLDDTGSPKYSWYTQVATFLPADNVGSVFKEVGLASGPGNVGVYLSTHAIIVDSEGSPLSITKTATMQIAIYSKFYFILGSDDYANTMWVSGLDASNPISGGGNFILKCCQLNVFMNDRGNYLYFYTGTGDAAVSYTDSPINTLLYSKGWRMLDTAGAYDVRVKGNYYWGFTYRLETGISNGKIKEIGSSFEASYTPSGGSSVSDKRMAIFRSVMPVTGVFTGSTFTAVELGTGDGVEANFTLGETDEISTFWTWNEINEANPTVYIDAIETTAFTYNDTTGVITFTTPPAIGEVVTATWSVPYIAKSNSYVVDITWRLSFSEGTVPV